MYARCFYKGGGKGSSDRWQQQHTSAVSPPPTPTCSAHCDIWRRPSAVKAYPAATCSSSSSISSGVWCESGRGNPSPPPPPPPRLRHEREAHPREHLGGVVGAGHECEEGPAGSTPLSRPVAARPHGRELRGERGGRRRSRDAGSGLRPRHGVPHLTPIVHSQPLPTWTCQTSLPPSFDSSTSPPGRARRG